MIGKTVGQPLAVAAGISDYSLLLTTQAADEREVLIDPPRILAVVSVIVVVGIESRNSKLAARLLQRDSSPSRAEADVGGVARDKHQRTQRAAWTL